MKLHKSVISKCFSVLLLSVLFFASSCEREYDAPPLSEPKYEGPSATTTLAALKAKYANITDPQLITDDYIIQATISGNDISGNIYKQLYIQDGTSGINIGVDQNSMYTSYRAGQEVFINLKGLSMVKYGGELQIGFSGTNANRISWEVFQEHTSLNGWPKEQNVTPLEVDLSKLDASMVNKLVMIKGVTFVNGGKNNFTSGNVTTNEQIKDANNVALDVRSSSYSSFAGDLLPVGKGTVVGLLGRFNGSWQLFLRDITDVMDFDGKTDNGGTTPTTPTGDEVFKETFGTGYYPSGSRPKIADFTDFDMKAPVKYVESTAVADIRSMSGDNGAHIWLPAAKDVNLVIQGIPNANEDGLSLSFQLAANLYYATDAMNLNVFKVKVNGTSYTVPSTPVSNASGDNSKFYTITIPNIAKAATSTIEFTVAGTDNTLGLRLDNIIIKKASSTGGSGAIIVSKD